MGVGWGGGFLISHSAITASFWREQGVTRNAPAEKSWRFCLSAVNSMTMEEEIQGTSTLKTSKNPEFWPSSTFYVCEYRISSPVGRGRCS
jgi:hypothetical protein